MFALDYQLTQILEVEGLENRFQRHIDMAEVTRAWAKKHFEMLAEDQYASNTLTTMKNTKGNSVADLNKELAKRGYMISNGYGTLKEKHSVLLTWQIWTWKRLKHFFQKSKISGDCNQNNLNNIINSWR